MPHRFLPDTFVPPYDGRRRRLILVAAVLLAVAVLAAGWSFVARRPPAIASLLPEADAIVYVDLRPVRLATHLEEHLPPRSPDYQQFVDSTGIVPERDLNEAAFAITARPDPDGPDGPVAWTEVLAGRFDGPRLEGYLRPLAARVESYAGHTVFVVRTTPATPATATTPASAARELRVTVVRAGLLALSNAPTPEQIHVILDHSRSPWMGAMFGQPPSVLAEHFREVPRLSVAWAVGRAGLPFAEAGHLTLFGLQLPVAANQPMVASLRYLGSLQLRVELFGTSPEAALQQSGALSGLLSVMRGLLSAKAAGIPAPLEQALDSVHVAPEQAMTVVTATLPLALLRDVASGGAPH